MNKLAVILLIVVIAYAVYTAYPSLTGDLVLKSAVSEKIESDLVEHNTDENVEDDVQKNKVSEPKQTEIKTERKKNLCESIVCSDSSEKCPDGFISKCKNTCTEDLCSNCKPSCEEHLVIETEEKNVNTVCSENWSCTAWSECLNGEQTRTCTDQNNCGTTSNKSTLSQTCAIEQKQLTLLVSTNNQTIVRGNDVEISVRVTYNSNPVENANVFVNLTYASGTVVSNSSFTNSTGDYFWVKRIGGNSKTGTFKISAEATKEGYANGLGEASFEVISKS